MRSRTEPALPMTLWHLSDLFLKSLSGIQIPLDPATAQRIGHADGCDILTHLCILCSGMLLVLLACQAVGVVVAKSFRLGRRKTVKISHCFSEMAYYVFSVFTLTRLCWHAPWFWPSGWHQVMLDGRVQEITTLLPYTAPADLKFFYLLETSYYLTSFLLLCWRPKKKDFQQMAFHHVITAALLLLSYYAGYIRIGVVVMYLHNLFDPFLLLAKCTHYAKIPYMPNVFFFSCAVTFAISRLLLYPLAIFHAWMGVCNGNQSCPGGVWDKTPIEFSLFGLLLFLLPIHVFWFMMIVKVLVIALRSDGVQGDVRSDSENEDESTTTKKHD